MAGQESNNSNWPRWRQVVSEHRFGFLLALLVVLLGGSAVLFGMGLDVVWFDALMAVMVLAAISSLCFDRRQRMFALLLGLPTIAITVGGHALSETAGRSVLFVGHLCGVCFFLGSAGLVVYSLFRSRALSFDSIFGAVCGYLFLGLGWATLYSMIETIQPDSFQISPSLRIEGNQSPHVLMYYSFVTLTTVGYGDVTPITAVARTLAWMEALTGQFYLAIIVAGLVSILVMNTQGRSQSDEKDAPH